MTAPSPLEAFVRDYVETTGGAWDEVEPQVYDVLVPAEGAGAGEDRQILRIAFDPEALPEHPGAQLASYGTPLVDRLLEDAVRRGRQARLYVAGLNLAPHDLPGQLRRAVALPEKTALAAERARALDFAQAAFWFRATFLSDQKEQEIVPAAVDLHYGRPVRHLDLLLDHGRLSTVPAQVLPEARRLSLAAAYPLAREAVLPTVAALANARGREAGGQLERQVARMRRYYGDLRAELAEQVERARGRGEDLERFAGRREALEREEQFRVGELRRKGALRVEVALLAVALVWQPKLLVRARVQGPLPREADTLELVWDPLVSAVEAAPCPGCGRPKRAWGWSRAGRLMCPACAARAPARPGK